MTDRRLRVLVMTSTFPRWQGDTQPPFVYNLCAILAQRFDVTVLAPHGPKCKSREQWDNLCIVRFRYFWPEGLERLAYGGILPNLKRNRLLWLLVPFFFAAELVATLRITRSRRIDVLHAHWVIPQGIIASLAGWINRTPVLVTCHAADIYGLRGPLQDGVKRWTLNRCSYITTVSHGLLEAVQALRVKRQIPTAVISMGVDTSTFNPSKRDEALRRQLCDGWPLLLFVGRLVEKKGVRHLLEAMPIVLGEYPDAVLVIVGDGPLRGELESLANSLQIGSHVRFIGASPQAALPPYYATADLFVGPSVVTDGGDTEGLPVVFIEAMASGCPAVGSAVPGIKEVIIPGHTGVLAPEGDSTALASEICNILQNHALRVRLRDEALLWVREHFDQHLLADRYGEVIAAIGGGVR